MLRDLREVLEEKIVQPCVQLFITPFTLLKQYGWNCLSIMCWLNVSQSIFSNAFFFLRGSFSKFVSEEIAIWWAWWSEQLLPPIEWAFSVVKSTVAFSTASGWLVRDTSKFLLRVQGNCRVNPRRSSVLGSFNHMDFRMRRFLRLSWEV